MALSLATQFVFLVVLRASSEVGASAPSLDDGLVSDFELVREADDECSPGSSCALSALQIRTQAVANGTGGVEDAGATTRFGHRRRGLYHWPPTQVTQSDHWQPATCWNQTLRRGAEGCCGRYIYAFATYGCCGQFPYVTSTHACCDHGNGYASIYQPLKQNCCDDDFKENEEGGICDLADGQTSCCKLSNRIHRRRYYSFAQDESRMQVHEDAAEDDLETPQGEREESQLHSSVEQDDQDDADS